MPPEAARQPINPERVVNMVCHDLNVSTADLRSKLRREPLPMARTIITHTLRNHSKLSYPEIARLMGGSSHSSVMEAEHRLLSRQYAIQIQGILPQWTNALDYCYSVGELCEEASQAA